jgi:hypothetical protein
VNSEHELLNSIYKDEGLSGIISLARARQKDGRNAGATLALAFAIQKATIVIESNKKTILIQLRNGRYTIFVWIPEYNTFVDFGFKGGIGYSSTMVLSTIAVRLIDAVEFLNGFETYLSSDPVAFSAFKPLFQAEYIKLKRTFGILV